MIRLVLVEDSPVQRELLLILLEEDGGFDVVGHARDGAEAVEVVARLKPDMVLMDYHLPKLNGAEATRLIMERTPVPVVVTSASLKTDDVAPTFEAVRAGALAVLTKPINISHPDHDRQVAELMRTLKLMAEVKVVRRWKLPPRPEDKIEKPPPHKAKGYDLVVMGGSTGAPAVIAEILSALPSDFGAPILIVQHMARGFSAGFTQWLDGKSKLRVRLAVEREIAVAGSVYIAPDDRHLGIDSRRRIVLTSEDSENGFRPSISVLFRAAARANGSATMGVILTGMGKDGVSGLKALREAGGLTVAQNEATCVVFGMPREAVRENAADRVLAPRGITRLMMSSISSSQQVSHVRT